MDKTDYSTLTKDWALDIICDRIATRWPGVGIAKERALLATRSRASLLHSVGAQLYGDTKHVDDALCAYAFGEMSTEERRAIRDAG